MAEETNQEIMPKKGRKKERGLKEFVNRFKKLRVSKKGKIPPCRIGCLISVSIGIRINRGCQMLFGHPRILLSELKVSTVESDLFIFSLLPIVRLSAGSDEIFFGTDFNILFISCRPVFGESGRDRYRFPAL